MNNQSEFDISSEIANKIKNRQWLKEELIAGKNGQKILNFSDETMSKFYMTAHHLFESKRYPEAANAFLFLSTLNPQHGDYWLGLGAATQRCEDYEGAIDAYEMAAICQLENPLPYFHLAKCLFAMHDRENALQAIELALEYAENIPEYDDIYHQAKVAKSLIIQEQPELGA